MTQSGYVIRMLYAWNREDDIGFQKKEKQMGLRCKRVKLTREPIVRKHESERTRFITFRTRKEYRFTVEKETSFLVE